MSTPRRHHAALAVSQRLIEDIELIVLGSASWERKRGHCSVCGPGVACDGVAEIGLHCWACRTPHADHDCREREENSDGDTLRFNCRACGEATHYTAPKREGRGR